ncbi:MAG: T9SS type A sorting domain-containing protein [Candidatus Kapabacteria bacterium]|nr:T9SS type A sorting domain-containing protein [Ignavibacteriota bacterium]MCW5883519.1 T9SS type A sorting domain-containing protein [Candidatus Kapabacteria bacterium]
MNRIFLFVIAFFAVTLVAYSQPTSVRLINPAGGEVYRPGVSIDLVWDTTGTLGARWTFQFATSADGPWTNLPAASNILDSAARRGRYAGGFRTPAVATTSGYVRMILVNPDGTLNEAVQDRNDNPFTIEQPQVTAPDSVLKDPIQGKVFLSRTKIYGLDGYVYVDDGGELHIQRGTIIIGDTVGQNSAICVNRGGKLFARGTKEDPIVMTSSAAPGQRRGGDWGGLLICGKASTNHPGGEAQLEGGIADAAGVRGWFGGKDNPDDNDNSGHYEYLRIEFAGIAAAPNQELNSLTMGGVGRGTFFSHIHVSYANDDAYEWFGGTADAKYLIATGTLDDDLDCDNGFSGRIQFALTQRHKDRADVSTSQTWETDNNSSGNYNLPLTSPVFSNVTAIGPLQDTSWTASATGAAPNTYHTRFGAAAQIRRNARTSIFNSVIAGWPRGIEILSAQGQLAASRDSLLFRNNSMFGIKGQTLRLDGTTPGIPANWLETAAYNNYADVSTPNNAALSNPFYVGNAFNAVPLSNANYLNNASFTNGNDVVKIDDPFFDRVPYRGAFSPVIAERWDLPWAEYDPINKLYERKSPASVETGHQWILDVNIYPNPANNVSSIIYQLPQDEVVTIKMFNTTGTLVNTIAQGLSQNQGFYEFSIDVRDLANGTYFVQIQTMNGVVTKQLNVIR